MKEAVEKRSFVNVPVKPQTLHLWRIEAAKRNISRAELVRLAVVKFIEDEKMGMATQQSEAQR